MIHIEARLLPDGTSHALAKLQADVNSVLSFAERVAEARRQFQRINRNGNTVFDVVKQTLTAMCSGACRCMYCEDSAASEIEHFRPKVFYPDLVFVWLNYLYSCGPCNRGKQSHFRLLTEGDVLVDLVRLDGKELIEPVAGTPVLLDPRSDDPPLFLSLDLQTFRFVPRDGIGTIAVARAEYTIQRLRLNDREILPATRKEAFDAYRARLFEYGRTQDESRRAALRAAIRRCGHPTVWLEMKRQEHLYPELGSLFVAAPEAREW